ncbi:MAG: hypothetical protein AB1726_11375 [Planctomycetota bacterium]
MEPIVASTVSHVIRPAAAAVKADLAAVLKDGRILAGEVLASPGNGTVLIAIGRHQVPAETNLLLEPGQHFLVLVQVQEKGGVLLTLLGAGDPDEAALLAALRGVIGEDRPVGECLAALAARLRAELRAPGEGFDGLRALLAGLEAHAAAPEGNGSELARLLARSGLFYEAALLAAARGGGVAALLAALGGDLKGELLAALASLPEGDLREAVRKALAGLESEQLLNLARQRSGEPPVWSFPFPDGDGWTTARLLVPRRQERDAEGGEGEGGEEPARLVLGVSFTGLGAMRIELARAESLLAVRILAAREDVAARIRADAGELARLLGDGAREVAIFARAGTPAEVSVAAHALDIPFLREHHLMDVSG